AREAPQQLPDLDEVCNFSARLRFGPPVDFPLTAAGSPAAPLPPGFWLPHPTVQDELPRAAALWSGAARAPPPELELREPSTAQHDAWQVWLRPVPPATFVLFTVDGSLPRPGQPSTRRAP
ncbi:unnamed protein product, partial [Polarella glacialis]